MLKKLMVYVSTFFPSCRRKKKSELFCTVKLLESLHDYISKGLEGTVEFTNGTVEFTICSAKKALIESDELDAADTIGVVDKLYINGRVQDSLTLLGELTEGLRKKV